MVVEVYQRLYMYDIYNHPPKETYHKSNTEDKKKVYHWSVSATLSTSTFNAEDNVGKYLTKNSY